ncbi:LytR/AlgR family response regulator transcription factor [Taibaiella soli]|uniref:DNA-binding response regulator n=1 Tax=Taibaiella soli TaxID=1649169 RepID=A0A2W2AI73_9BACT|nr:LytTR family DNA-binding domain-containing protein [Taibaiella soli]PZF71910.1 DNA-binding response regulator [Taibaiella soli]
MNIIIVEDELKTAQSLEKIISGIRPEANVIGRYQSIEDTVSALSVKGMPNLIFMDVQLADGLCFEIFKLVEVTCPVVFCTAFDEYALKAFKNGGIDYVLKPFSKEDIEAAFKKVDELQNFFQQHKAPDLDGLLTQLNTPKGKTSFLVFLNQKYKTIHIDDIAFFYIKHDGTWIATFDKQQYPINQSLDQLTQAVSTQQFYRLNRQYLVNFKAIKEIEPYFMRKLFVRLVIETPDKLLVNKEKSGSFLAWMENR